MNPESIAVKLQTPNVFPHPWAYALLAIFLATLLKKTQSTNKNA